MIGIAFLALGLVLIIEGLAYALAPSFVERMLQALSEIPENARRSMGAIAIVIGLVFLWVANQLGVTVSV
jgi:uncharacterized protein YjeT (DUF2065 family)